MRSAMPDKQPLFRSILCGVDFSAHSRHALQAAAAIAKRFRGQVTALSVDELLLVAAAADVYGTDGQVRERNRMELAGSSERRLDPRHLESHQSSRSAVRPMNFCGSPGDLEPT